MIVAFILLNSALICFQGHCYPALVGRLTPTGDFSVVHKSTKAPGYGGDILVFDELPDRVYAIHRMWLLIPSQHREERLDSADPLQRRNVTEGCVNISPEVYDQLKDSLIEVKIIKDDKDYPFSQVAP